jgi:hypothetical protein
VWRERIEKLGKEIRFGSPAPRRAIKEAEHSLAMNFPDELGKSSG